MKQLLLFLTLVTISVSYGQKLKVYSVDHMRICNVIAGSPLVDSTALGGYANSSHYPVPTEDPNLLDLGTVSLLLDDSNIVPYEDTYFGYSLYLANNTDSVVAFPAADSRLFLTAEVFLDGKWQTIERQPEIWCGNSYHRVLLAPGYHWNFTVPKFDGETNVKLRYKLMYAIDYGTTRIQPSIIYSNEIDAKINRSQTQRKENAPEMIEESK